MAKHQLRALDDHLALKLARRADYRAAFPEIAAAAPEVRCCGGNRTRIEANLAQVRRAVAGLPPHRLDALKQMLGAEQLLVVTVEGGQVREVRR